jgi:agmatine deiminase
MPAEWELHEATWLAWPHNEETWPEKVPQVEEIYLQMIEALAEGEKVHLLVNDPRTRDRVTRRLEARRVRTKNVVYFQIPTVDAWIRDYGPCFVLGGPADKKHLALVKWIFNAWGEKYESLMKDNETGDVVAQSLEMPRYFPEVVLEGGAIDTNGEGTCLVTEQCLLNPNRNPALSKAEIENRLRDFLGFTHFVWLGEGIEGDDTDGHIDDITRFVNPTTVVTAVENNSHDRNEVPLRENLRRLEKATNEKGANLNVVPIPMPGRVEGPWGRLPASYLNFYVANGVVLVPIFGHENDDVALKTLQGIFPKRRVVGIRSEVLVLGLGGIHCVTHEQPASR